MNKLCFLPIIVVLSGCNSLFPEQKTYVPPMDNADVAKIRLIGPPMSYAIYQKDSNNNQTGGWVEKHSRYFNPFLGSTKDIGLPKISGKNYKDDYFETYIQPDMDTSIYHSLYQGCHVSLDFKPGKAKMYEAHISYGDKTGYCVLYLKEVVMDKINGVYVEKDITK
ncbi:MAG TPA: hypothetical protein VH187_10865 [Scandinavium sp.]|jgi:hypothetical protein|uniref:hypothetical protein n=1 Tax=Scandinavium sp. TaxID=2830653 RepID=UPI002E2F18BC|nr:hypothetical protein [Scandinavium sp.]HEX4501636.1 hypothetical protein [Scandinavium sp.]